MNDKAMVSSSAEPTRNHKMSASEIARRHFDAAVTEAEAAGLGHDSICRSLLGLVVSKVFDDERCCGRAVGTAFCSRQLRSGW
jgi:hypothetical protein